MNIFSIGAGLSMASAVGLGVALAPYATAIKPGGPHQVFSDLDVMTRSLAPPVQHADAAYGANHWGELAHPYGDGYETAALAAEPGPDGAGK